MPPEGFLDGVEIAEAVVEMLKSAVLGLRGTQDFR